MTTHARAALLAIALALPCAPLLSCDGESAEQTETDGPRIARYEVRGRIVSLPAEDSPLSELVIHHEPIPSFRDNLDSEEPIGMNAMQMEFPLAEGVSLEGHSVGDKVTLTFEVSHDRETGAMQSYRATAIEPLDPDTELNFETPPPVDEDDEDDEPSS